MIKAEKFSLRYALFILLFITKWQRIEQQIEGTGKGKIVKLFLSDAAVAIQFGSFIETGCKPITMNPQVAMRKLVLECFEW